MNDPEIKEATAPEQPAAPESLDQQVASLQRQVSWLLIVLMLVSGTLCVFLWRQARIARKDLQSFKLPAGQIIQAFQRDKSAMDAFVAKVAEYGKTHSDFAPIMEKYKIQVATNPAPGAVATPKPAAAPAPATPAAPATAPKK
jgi:hypothetical protein